jgi:hypothetical protein
MAGLCPQGGPGCHNQGARRYWAHRFLTITEMPPTTWPACLKAARWLLLPLAALIVAPAPAADEPAPFATVWRLRGDLRAAGPAGAERSLREGDSVRVGERLRAAATGEAVLKTADAGYLAVRPGAEFVAERFAAEGGPGDNLTLRLVSGGLRIITGWIGRLNRAGHRVVTPTATIGIRGTDHEPYVVSAELARTLSQRAGTYDKVNRGGTTLEVDGNAIDIDTGKVGFVRAATPYKSRALMTLLLPVLLDKVPDFYVPGAFDAELDALAEGGRGRQPAPARGAAASRALGHSRLAARRARRDKHAGRSAPSHHAGSPSGSAKRLALRGPGARLAGPTRCGHRTARRPCRRRPVRAGGNGEGPCARRRRRPQDP